MNSERPNARRAFFWVGVVLCLMTTGIVYRHFSLTAVNTPDPFSGPTMGTTYNVQVVDLPASVDAESLHKEIQTRLNEIDARMSTYREDSELSRLNRAEANQWINVSEELAGVLNEAIHVGDLTSGAFDVTVGPLVNLWSFGPDKEAEEAVPTDDAIAAARESVGHQHLQVRLKPPASSYLTICLTAASSSSLDQGLAIQWAFISLIKSMLE